MTDINKYNFDLKRNLLCWIAEDDIKIDSNI